MGNSLSGVPTDVPDGTMPVATRLGDLDKASFIRLSGTATTLTLHEDTDGDARRLGSRVGRGVPDHRARLGGEAGSAARRRAGVGRRRVCRRMQESDNTWVFDLSGFADRAGQAGFALVPALRSHSPADFQITFLTS